MGKIDDCKITLFHVSIYHLTVVITRCKIDCSIKSVLLPIGVRHNTLICYCCRVKIRCVFYSMPFPIIDTPLVTHMHWCGTRTPHFKIAAGGKKPRHLQQPWTQLIMARKSQNSHGANRSVFHLQKVHQNRRGSYIILIIYLVFLWSILLKYILILTPMGRR